MCEQKSEQKKAFKIINIILFVLFVISLVPHLFASYECVVGYTFFFDECKGIGAWILLMVLAFNYQSATSTIMIVSIIYQIAFLAYQLINPTPYMKRLIKITTIVAAIVIFVPLIIVDIIKLVI